MLKGLLPTLKAEKNQNQKNPLNQKPNPQNQGQQGQNEAFRAVGLNLLSNFQPASELFKIRPIPILILRRIIITLSLILGFLLVLNYSLFIYIGKLKIQQDKLSNDVLSLSGTEKTAISIDRKVTYYKNLLKLRKLISPRAGFVLENIAEGININKLSITYPNFEITATAKDVYAFTKLISNYLSGNYVSEIVLKKADLNTQTKEYEFTIGGIFK